MTDKPEKDKPSSGYKTFSWEQFEKMCALPPVIKQEDIAFVMGVSVDTCDRKIKEMYPEMTFAEFRRRKQQHINMSILSKQYERAHEGYWPALKWMGVNYAEQSDRVLVETELKDKINYDVDDL